jgi:hypothetical protein
MNRRQSARGHGRMPRRGSEGDADNTPWRARRRDEGTRESHPDDDHWRKHPRASLDSELALVPLWRRPSTGR